MSGKTAVGCTLPTPQTLSHGPQTHIQTQAGTLIGCEPVYALFNSCTPRSLLFPPSHRHIYRYTLRLCNQKKTKLNVNDFWCFDCLPLSVELKWHINQRVFREVNSFYRPHHSAGQLQFQWTLWPNWWALYLEINLAHASTIMSLF